MPRKTNNKYLKNKNPIKTKRSLNAQDRDHFHSSTVLVFFFGKKSLPVDFDCVILSLDQSKMVPTRDKWRQPITPTILKELLVIT